MVDKPENPDKAPKNKKKRHKNDGTPKLNKNQLAVEQVLKDINEKLKVKRLQCEKVNSLSSVSVPTSPVSDTISQSLTNLFVFTTQVAKSNIDVANTVNAIIQLLILKKILTQHEVELMHYIVTQKLNQHYKEITNSNNDNPNNDNNKHIT